MLLLVTRKRGWLPWERDSRNRFATVSGLGILFIAYIGTPSFHPGTAFLDERTCFIDQLFLNQREINPVKLEVLSQDMQGRIADDRKGLDQVETSARIVKAELGIQGSRA